MQIDKDLLRALKVESIDRYLNYYGWEIKESVNPNAAQYVKWVDSFGEDVALFVPKKNTFKSYPLRIMGLLEQLSDVQKKPIPCIFEDISMFLKDRISLRVFSRSQNKMVNSLSLLENKTFSDSIYDIFAYAIRSETSRVPAMYYNSKTKKTQEILEKIRYGQTKKGSFIMNFYFPVEEENNERGVQLLEPELLAPNMQEKPLLRRVINRIFSGLSNTQDAISTERIEKITENYRSGFNGNMCEAFANMLKESSKPLEIKIKMSPLYTEQSLHREIILEPETYSILHEAGEKLKSQQALSDIEVEGVVLVLSREAENNDSKNYDFEIKVDCEDQNGKLFKNLLVVVNNSQHEMAYSAYHEKKKVKLKGTLVSERNTRRIENVTSLSVLEE